MPGRFITLICLRCGRRAPYNASVDPDLPTHVESIEQSYCDQCENGEKGHNETWRDKDDNIIPQF